MRQSDFTIINQVLNNTDQTLVLVGTALDGPSNVPFSLNPDVDAIATLDQSPLLDAYLAASAVGLSNIVLYRLNGIHTTGTLVDKNDKALIEFRSVCAADKYNDIQMVVYADHLFTVDTDGVSRSYFFDKYPKVMDLVYAINRDSYYGLVEFTAVSLDDQYLLANVVDTPTQVILKGGDTEDHLISSRDPLSESPTDQDNITPLIKEKVKVALFGESPDDIEDRMPNSNLGTLHNGVIALCDIYHDDDVEFTEMLGSFCLNKTAETGYGCIGVIGTRPIYPAILDEGETEDFSESIHTRVLDLISLSESLVDMEAYKYVQVIVGQTEIPNSIYTSTSATYGYAATQAQIPYHLMMSNKGISGIGKLNFALTKEDVALLTANGYTCIVPSIRRGFVPYYAVSFSKDSDGVSSKPHNLRISQQVSQIIVEEVDILVGEAYNILSLKGTIAKAKELLDDLAVKGVFKNYTLDYELSNDLTVLTLSVSITPYSEVKAISSIATISFPQGVIE